MAVLGGILFLLVRKVRRTVGQIAERLARPARSLCGGGRRGAGSQVVSLRAEGNRTRPAADPRDAWWQITIRTRP
ncbi:MAG TPA: hypothetical protein VE871_02720 [Longimicrobium sp.]|nr:hypothetical protein [Longimicrobium sp.]